MRREALFEQALKIDPNDADALGGRCYRLFRWNTCADGTTAETDYEARMLGQADRAIALAPDNMSGV